MTSSSHLSADVAVPVSLELLQVLDAFSSHASAIFEDLSIQGARQSAQTDANTSSSASLRSLNALSELDERLAGLVQKAKIHKANQRRIEQLEHEMMKYELEWREEMMSLEEHRLELGRLVDRGRKDRASIERAAKAQLKPSTILSYARMLAPYTSAPPQHHLSATDDAEALKQQESNPASIPGAILPYPTEEVMRRGRLAFEEVGEIGETTGATGAKPATPKGMTGEIKPNVAPVPAATAARRPLNTAPIHAQPEEEEDFAFDLDLNPDL